MQRSTFALGIAATLICSGFAQAQAEDVRQREVSYADLDLSRSENASILYSRIERAARSVCEVTTIPQPRARVLEQDCMANAVNEAVHSVGNSNLTAVHTAEGGKRTRVAARR